MSKPALVVIGHGMVGQHFLEQIAREGLATQYHIVVFGDEPIEAYDCVHLTDYFAGRDAQAPSLVKPGFMAEHDIEQVKVGAERQGENSLALPLVTKMFLGDRWEYLFRTAGEQFVVRAYGDDGRLDGVCALSLPADKVWIFPASAHGAP